MIRSFKNILYSVLHNYVLPYLVILPSIFFISFYVGRFRKKNKEPRLVWGITPILNYKYLSESMKNIGYESKTFMLYYYDINKKEDFDMYPEDVFKHIYHWLFKPFRHYICFIYSLIKFDIFHITFDGFFLSLTPLKNFEHFFLKLSGKKTIVFGYGSDYYRYSRVSDPSIRHVLLASYPLAGKLEYIKEKKFNYWTKNADIIIGGALSVDGWGRWDVLTCNYIIIDCQLWKKHNRVSNNDGRNGIVKITHTPNHRDFKGTIFIINAINKLKEEGYKVELNLLEKLSNDKVREILMNHTDILVEQLIYVTYALSGIEGMACGLPVICNMSEEKYTKFLRRFSYLNECPILTATPENIKDKLKILITNPELRKILGDASRKYAEKYHSYQTSQYLYSKIYNKIWHNKNEDLINIYNPNIKNSYNYTLPIIEHPLVNNDYIEKS